MTDAPTALPPSNEPAPLGAMARIAGVFFSPRPAFTDIARKPTWLVPLILLVVFATAASFVVTQKTDWRNFFERKMESSRQFDQMSQEQKDGILEKQVAWAPKIGLVVAPVFTIILALIMALIYWGAFNLFNGAGFRFGQSFGITVHGFLPGLVSSVLIIIAGLLKAKGDVDPEHPLAANLGALLPASGPHWLDVLGTSIDLFAIWSLILLAIGFSAANPRKVKPGSAYMIVFGIWILFILARVGWAAL